MTVLKTDWCAVRVCISSDSSWKVVAIIRVHYDSTGCGSNKGTEKYSNLLCIWRQSCQRLLADWVKHGRGLNNSESLGWANN